MIINVIPINYLATLTTVGQVILISTLASDRRGGGVELLTRI